MTTATENRTITTAEAKSRVLRAFKIKRPVLANLNLSVSSLKNLVGI